MRRFAVHFAFAASLILGFALVLNGSVLKVLTGTWHPAGNMSSARTNATAVLVPDGRIVFAGGTDVGGQPTATAEAFSSSGTFSSLSAMSAARSGHAAILTMSGDLLVTGGRTSGGGTTNSVEVFDSLTSRWHSLPATMVEPRSGHTMSQLQDGNILIAGGENSSGPVAALEIYDLASDTFSFAGVLATARKGHSAAALLDGRVLIAGGTMLQADGSTATLASTEIYDPTSGTVTAGPKLATPRVGATATTLIDGRVLIAGGSYPEGAPNTAAELASAEIFDPASSTITASASQMNTARAGHIAILLPNNNSVLIAGGTSAGANLASAELYIPWNDAFQPTDSMAAARSAAAGSALGNGTYIGVDGLAVVAGGNNQTGAEVYGFATVRTDKTDYMPGEVVTITGQGWKPGETVTLTLVESPNVDTPPTMTAVADANGNFVNTGFSPDQYDLTIHFYLTATGSQSQAQVTFSDGTVLAAPLATYSSNCSTSATTFAAGEVVCAKVGPVSISGGQGTGNVHLQWINPNNSIIRDTTFSANNNQTVSDSFAPSTFGTWTLLTCKGGAATPPAACGQSNVFSTVQITVTSSVTTTTAANASAIVSTSSQIVPLSATVTSASTVNAGTVTFTIKDASNNTVGTPVTSGTVSGGAANANYTLPTNTAAGTYSINAAYSGATGFDVSSDNSHTLTVGKSSQTITFGALAGKTYGDPDFTVSATASSGLAVSFSSVTTGICTVNGAVVHIVANGTCTVRASQAGDTNWSAAPNVDQGFTVGKKAATWTTTSANKTYGDADPSPLTTGSGSGFLASDGVSATYARVVGETVAGGPYLINATLSATVPGALDNYIITNAGANFTINPRAATWTTNAASKTYGDADTSPITTGAGTGFLTADGVSATYARAAGETVLGGPYHITATLAPTAVLSNYNVTNAGASFSIMARPASVTPAASGKTYGDSELTLTGTLSGFISADNVTAIYGRTGGETVVGSPYTISATLSPVGVLSNYNITYNTANFTITPRPALVTPNPAGKMYGEADPALSGTLSQFLPTDGVTATYGRTGGETVVGSPYTITATLSPVGVLTNYNITYNTANFTITPRPASVTPNPATKIYGDADPAFSGTLSGFLTGDGVTASFSRISGETALGSPYNISAVLTPAGVLSNYSITYNTASFTITRRGAAVTPNAASKTYGDPDPTLAGTLSGFLPADNVTAAYSRAAGEAVVGSLYAISAVLSPASVLDNYAINYGTAAFSINARPVTVMPKSGQNKIYGDNDPMLTFAITSGNLIGTDSFSGALSRDSGQNVGLFEIVGGSLTLGSNYSLSVTPGVKFEITPRPITVTADNKTKVYGDLDPGLTFTIGGSGLAYSDNQSNSFTGTLARATGESVLGGPYAITQGTLTSNSNYKITSFTPGQLTITTATLSITPDGGKTKVYGDPFTLFTGTTAGLKFSDAVNVTYASAGAALNTSVGSYDITVAAVNFTVGAASNYVIVTATASKGLVVTQRLITVTADAKTKAYLAPDPALTFHITLGNLVNGDTFTGSLTRVLGELPGTYAILQGTLALSPNYALSYVGANLTITYGQCSAAIGPGNVILPPINSDGTSVYQRKGGSTIPVKFRVCDYQGNPISNPAAVFAGTGGSLSMLSVVRGTVTVVNEDGTTDIPDVAFRWTGDQWAFNMATTNLSSGSTYQFRINLAYGNIVFVVGVK